MKTELRLKKLCKVKRKTGKINRNRWDYSSTEDNVHRSRHSL
jgi:hypothetical protein